jgi:Tfp pilus assembly protein PilF
MSQIYKKDGQFDGYVTALEAAFTLSPEHYDYSLELGKALAQTVKKVKALYHIERYINNKEDGIDPGLYLLAGNLSEDTGHYLKTQDYYQKYLSEKKDDGAIHFALGYIARAKTGNHKLALSSFARTLELLPENDIYRRSKANEYTADISLSDLQLKRAIEHYNETIRYQKQVLEHIESSEAKVQEISRRINSLKIEIMKEQNYDSFREYESLEEEKGKLALALNKERRQYELLNCGAVRWNIASAYERTGEYENAIEFYRQAISFNYRSGDSREKIIKLQLKIKRGY